MRRILVTGGAGFIGSNLIDRLIKEPNIKITCLDNFDPFYNPKVKKRNIKAAKTKENFVFIKGDIRSMKRIKNKLLPPYDVIIHLAAKVGVIPSMHDPITYTEVNVLGTQNLLEFAKEIKCKKFIFASSSSVYGVNTHVPWREDESVLKPISPYASTKISGELLGHVYSHLYGIQFLALRFFAVYGPRQRPDLAIHKFARLISKGRPLPVYGDGKTKRDYTYVDDIVSGIRAALNYQDTQYEIINLGNNQPVELRMIISLLEKALGKKAIIKKLRELPGDVPLTYADIKKARKLLRYKPKTNLQTGLEKFVSWFKDSDEKNT